MVTGSSGEARDRSAAGPPPPEVPAREGDGPVFMLIHVYAYRGGDRFNLGEFAAVQTREDRVVGHPGSYELLRRSSGELGGRGESEGSWVGAGGEIYDWYETTTVGTGRDGDG